ncbi:MAG: ferrous iron transport protein [Clostridiales bacterium]|nr:ferrous iron transport protein [Clostridiales bacterium]MDN5298531.1 ferrous iron transport protein [Clostridiales bacterium]
MVGLFANGFGLKARSEKPTSLERAAIGETYTINAIKTTDDEMKHFLFTLGCFEGEHVTLVSVLSDLYVISVKDARYSIDRELASAIGID